MVLPVMNYASLSVLLCKFTFCYVHYFSGDQLTNYSIGECTLNNIASFLPMTKSMQNCPACKELGKIYSETCDKACQVLGIIL